MHICILTADYTVKPVFLKAATQKEDQLSLNAGRKYCRMLQGEHSAILKTFIKLPFVIKIFVFSFLSGFLRHVFFCIDYLHVHSVLWSSKTRCKITVFIKVRFFHN